MTLVIEVRCLLKSQVISREYAYIQNTKQIMANNPAINKIFVASDNCESITAFVEEFGQVSFALRSY